MAIASCPVAMKSFKLLCLDGSFEVFCLWNRCGAVRLLLDWCLGVHIIHRSRCTSCLKQKQHHASLRISSKYLESQTSTKPFLLTFVASKTCQTNHFCLKNPLKKVRIAPQDEPLHCLWSGSCLEGSGGSPPVPTNRNAYKNPSKNPA